LGDLMSEQLRFRGVVCSGSGRGSYFTQLEWFKERVRRKLGFNPVPGTLNVKLHRPEDLEALRASSVGVPLEPPKDYPCGGLGFHAKLRRPGDRWWVRASIVIPLIHGYYEDVVELIAAARLREVASLRDGDEVEVGVVGGRAGGEVRALLIDLDGTILDNVDASVGLVNRVLADHGLSPIAPREFKEALSAGSTLPELISKHYPHLDGGAVRRLLGRIREAWAAVDWSAYVSPSARRLVEAAKGRGVGVAVISSTDADPGYVIEILDRAELSCFIDVVLTREGGGLKPSPQPIFRACERLGVEPEECLVVGDAVVDVKAGKLAGSLTCGVATGVSSVEGLLGECPDVIAGSLDELLEVLERRGWRLA